MEDCKQVTQVYLGHPIYSLFADGEIDKEELEDRNQKDREMPKQKIQKRKNTIALPYLQPRKQAKAEAKAED